MQLSEPKPGSESSVPGAKCLVDEGAVPVREPVHLQCEVVARPRVVGGFAVLEELGEAVVTAHAAVAEGVLTEVRPQGPGDAVGEAAGPTPSTVPVVTTCM